MYVHWLVFHLVLPTEMDSETGRLGGVKKILSTYMWLEIFVEVGKGSLPEHPFPLCIKDPICPIFYYLPVQAETGLGPSFY